LITVIWLWRNGHDRMQNAVFKVGRKKNVKMQYNLFSNDVQLQAGVSMLCFFVFFSDKIKSRNVWVYAYKACRIVSISVRVDILVRPSQRISLPVPRRLRVRRIVKGI
jgi:hypothetical protein